jgi:hypothetical protein
VEIESIDQGFDQGSSVGPLDPRVPNPGQHEFWTTNQSPFNDTSLKDVITVAPGQKMNGINIILNGTPARFDQFEDGGTSRLHLPLSARQEQAVLA